MEKEKQLWIRRNFETSVYAANCIQIVVIYTKMQVIGFQGNIIERSCVGVSAKSTTLRLTLLAGSRG